MQTDQLIETTWKNLRGELHGFLVGQVGEPATADDLLQDVFLKLHRRVGDLKAKTSPRAWLYQVARIETPTEELMRAKLAPCLRRMIERLPAVYADAVRLTDLDELPQAVAAQRLGISLTALKSRARRGRAQLKEMLLQCCEFELSTAGRVLDYWPRRVCCVHSSLSDPSSHSHQPNA